MPHSIKEFFVKSYQKRKVAVTGLIVHYISAINVAPNDPFDFNKIIEIFNTYGVSADFMIDREGAIFRLVPKDAFSYHAGVSEYPNGITHVSSTGVRCLNSITVGVELIGLHGQPFTDAQYNALVWLTQHLKANEHPTMDYANLYGHNEVATPLGRKIDPGPSFDWTRYKTGLGLISVESNEEQPVEKSVSDNCSVDNPTTESTVGKVINFLLALFQRK